MRARDIKPGFFRNDELAECSFAARLLYPGLWMLADREGRLEYRPKRIKAEILPYDNVDVVELLSELQKQGLIVKYAAGGSAYLWIPAFKKHQSPHVKEKPSEIPACPDEAAGRPGANPVQAPGRPGADPSSSLTPSSLPPEDQESPVGDLPPAGEAAGFPPPCPHEKILALYHEILPELPQARTWGNERQRLLRSRHRETWERLRKKGEPHGPEALLDWWRKYFLRVKRSPFLVGRELDRQGKPFFADLEWLVRPGNYAKVIDGKFLPRRSA